MPFDGDPLVYGELETAELPPQEWRNIYHCTHTIVINGQPCGPGEFTGWDTFPSEDEAARTGQDCVFHIRRLSGCYCFEYRRSIPVEE